MHLPRPMFLCSAPMRNLQRIVVVSNSWACDSLGAVHYIHAKDCAL
jgi:hypothetical protein